MTGPSQKIENKDSNNNENKKGKIILKTMELILQIVNSLGSRFRKRKAKMKRWTVWAQQRHRGDSGKN